MLDMVHSCVGHLAFVYAGPKWYSCDGGGAWAEADAYEYVQVWALWSRGGPGGEQGSRGAGPKGRGRKGAR